VGNDLALHDVGPPNDLRGALDEAILGRAEGQVNGKRKNLLQGSPFGGPNEHFMILRLTAFHENSGLGTQPLPPWGRGWPAPASSSVRQPTDGLAEGVPKASAIFVRGGCQAWKFSLLQVKYDGLSAYLEDSGMPLNPLKRFGIPFKDVHGNPDC
jgi:hypothetical protein